jgi:hypothetical protein
LEEEVVECDADAIFLVVLEYVSSCRHRVGAISNTKRQHMEVQAFERASLKGSKKGKVEEKDCMPLS